VSHYWFGWGLFLIVLLVLFVYERRLPPGKAPAPLAPDARASGGTRMVAAGAMLALAIVAIPALVNPVIDARSVDDLGALAQPPAPAQRWRAISAPRSTWSPVQLGADLEQRWSFGSDAGEVEIYGAWYRRQAQRKKLGGFANRPAGTARLLEEYPVSVQGRAFAARRVAEADGQQALLWLQYRIGDRRFVSATRAQLWYSAYALGTFRSPPSSVRVLRTACRPDCAAATTVLTQFVEQSEATL
jgi:hypothetical protein